MKKSQLNSINFWKFSGFLLIIISFLSGSCSKEEEKKLEAFSPEAFAYDLGGSWEVNASSFVKGFKQERQGASYTALLSYDLDLVTPKGDTIKSLISRTEDKKNNEEMIDTQLEAQFDLDSTYTPGKYTVVFRIKDGMTNHTAVSYAVFNLSAE